MTKRDRIVISVILSVGLLAAMWFVALAPKRDESAQLDKKIATEQTRLTTAQASTATARDAKARYEADYAAVARLGQAVPADEETASLIYELDHAAGRAEIDFRSLKLDGSGSGTGGASAAAPAPSGTTAPATGATGATGASGAAAPVTVNVGDFPAMPFTFTVDGSFFHLESFLRRVAKLTAVKGKSILVRGRLVSVTGVQVSASKKGFPRISATVTATAYQLPASEGLTNGATPSGPAPAGASTAAATAPTSTAAPATPATAALTATGGGK